MLSVIFRSAILGRHDPRKFTPSTNRSEGSNPLCFLRVVWWILPDSPERPPGTTGGLAIAGELEECQFTAMCAQAGVVKDWSYTYFVTLSLVTKSAFASR
jgi:hypothetical protein